MDNIDRPGMTEQVMLVRPGTERRHRMSLGPAPVEELLVVADHAFVEDGDVPTCGLNVQVPFHGRADVDGQAVVDQVGGERPAEIMGREPYVGEFGVHRDKGFGGPADEVPDHRDRHRGWS
jgi:hypothetical protein